MIYKQSIFLFFSATITISACVEKEISFYKNNSSNLLQLAKRIQTDPRLDTLRYCCVNQNKCLDFAEINMMNSLDITCVSKDTSARTISFTISDKNLKKTHLVYLYDNKKLAPISYPKAGIEIKKINDNWFLEINTFD
jgi:hypothetical protein